MRNQVRLWAACGIFVVAISCATLAHAQNGPGSGAYGGNFGYYGLGLYNYNMAGGSYQRPPYYAIYPPVYYSYPVARPYGYSPYAYPPGFVTPEVKPPAAGQVMSNPYYKKPDSSAPSADKSAAAARTYFNPFVQQARAR